MQYGAHLPLIALEEPPATLAQLIAYARQAAALGFQYLCVNDHLLFKRPWLDGPSALAATLEASGGMTLATTVALPVVRGPVQTAKLLATLDQLSCGRVLAGVGPGSSPHDYAAAGIPFEQRWTRFDESVQALRALLHPDTDDFVGTYYATKGISLQPPAAQRPGPPIWIASWGSPARLRQVARLGDGWLASAYNTTPGAFSAAADALKRYRTAPGDAPNAIATMWLYVTDVRRDRDRIVSDVLAPLLNRPADALAELRLPVGSPEACAEALSAYAEAGAQRVFVWPLADHLHQLERFREYVAPLVVTG